MRARLVIALAAYASAISPRRTKSPVVGLKTRGGADSSADEAQVISDKAGLGIYKNVKEKVAYEFASGTLKADQLFNHQNGIDSDDFHLLLEEKLGLKFEERCRAEVDRAFRAKDGKFYSEWFNVICSAVFMGHDAQRLLHEDNVIVPDILADQRDNSKLIAVVAHNDMKEEMNKFIKEEKQFFMRRRIISTNTTGTTIENIINKDLEERGERTLTEDEKRRYFQKVQSGPLGGDQEIGAAIARGDCAACFFFIDPLAMQGHDADIKALIRLCDVHNIPVATNRASGKNLAHSLRYNADQIIKMHGDHKEPESNRVKKYKAIQKETQEKLQEQMEK